MLACRPLLVTAYPGNVADIFHLLSDTFQQSVARVGLVGVVACLATTFVAVMGLFVVLLCWRRPRYQRLSWRRSSLDDSVSSFLARRYRDEPADGDFRRAMDLEMQLPQEV